MVAAGLMVMRGEGGTVTQPLHYPEPSSPSTTTSRKEDAGKRYENTVRSNSAIIKSAPSPPRPTTSGAITLGKREQDGTKVARNNSSTSSGSGGSSTTTTTVRMVNAVPPPPPMAWTPAEDLLLRDLVNIHGTDKWPKVSQSFPGRTEKQCRQRWETRLDKGVGFGGGSAAATLSSSRFRPGDWSPDEEIKLARAHSIVGSK